MAGAERTFTVRLLGDATGAQRAFSDVAGSAEHTESRFGAFASGVGRSMAAAGIAVGGLAAASVPMINAATDLAETQSKVGVIFGGAAGQIDAFAADAAKSLGQSRQQAMDAAATFAVFGKSAGLSGNNLATFSTDLTALASDLASFNNTSPEDAIEAIGAALRGEAEPMRRYGVLLDDATMRQKAFEMGLISSTKEALTPANKVLAAQALIMEKTSDAQGDFARTSDGLANKQRILSAQFANVQAQIGEKLLPVALRLATWASETMIPALLELGSRLEGPLTTAFNTVSSVIQEDVFPVMQAVFGWLAENVPPVLERLQEVASAVFGWMRDNIPPALAAVSTFVQEEVLPRLERLGNFIRDELVPRFQSIASWINQNVVPALQSLAAFFVEHVLPAVGKIVEFVVDKLIPALASIVTWIADKVIPILGAIAAFVIDKVVPAFEKIAGFITDKVVPALVSIGEFIVEKVIPNVQKFIDKIEDIASTLAGWVVDVWNFGGQVLDWFRELPGKLTGAVGDLADLLLDIGRDIIRGLWRGMREVWGDVTGWLGGIGGKIKDLKGPIEKDRLLLTAEGAAIMGGLQAGMESGWGRVESWLGDRSADLQGAMSASLDLNANGSFGTSSASPMSPAPSASNVFNLTVNVNGGLGSPQQIGTATAEAMRRELAVLLRGAVA